jgi:hypothetical protein
VSTYESSISNYPSSHSIRSFPIKMNPQDPARVPSDMWICCNCDGGNLIAIAKERCPVCTHARCSNYCKGPNTPLDDWSGPFSSQGHPDAFSTEDPASPMSSTPPTYRSSMKLYVVMAFNIPEEPVTLPAAGKPCSGYWVCDNCGASNSGLTPDFCPVCGTRF